MVSILVPAG